MTETTTTSDKPASDKTDLASRRKRPKVPPFARYKGTSAWRKDRRRVRAYARFQAEARAGHPQFGAVHA